MIQDLYDNYVFLYIMGGLCGLGVFLKCFLLVVYNKLIKASESMTSTNKNWLKNMRLRFESSYQLQLGVNDVDTYVDKYVSKIKYGGLLLSTWENLSGQTIGLCLLTGSFAGILGFVYECGQGPVLFTFFAGAWTAIIVNIVDNIVNISAHKQMLRYNLIDYFENNLKVRMEQEIYHPEARRKYQRQYFTEGVEEIQVANADKDHEIDLVEKDSNLLSGQELMSDDSSKKVEKQARKQAKQDEIEAKKNKKEEIKQAKLNKVQAKKQARHDAKQAKKQAKLDAIQAKKQAKLDKKQQLIEEKKAKKRAREDFKIAKEKAIIEDMLAKKQAKESQKAAAKEEKENQRRIAQKEKERIEDERKQKELENNKAYREKMRLKQEKEREAIKRREEQELAKRKEEQEAAKRKEDQEVIKRKEELELVKRREEQKALEKFKEANKNKVEDKALLVKDQPEKFEKEVNENMFDEVAEDEVISLTATSKEEDMLIEEVLKDFLF